MWHEILQADSLLDIIEHFIKRYNDEDGKPVVIFPRFHQLRAVRKLCRMVAEEGPGHNYLIQHSAGSGKNQVNGLVGSSTSQYDQCRPHSDFRQHYNGYRPHCAKQKYGR